MTANATNDEGIIPGDRGEDPPKGRTARAFVAVVPSAAQRDAIRAARDRLARRAHARGASRGPVRWIPDAQLHLTLAFLGDVPRARLDAIAEALDDVAAARPAFALAYAGLGAFPRPDRPRVAWIGVGEGAEALAALAADVRRALAAANVPLDAKPFRPHLTLGRVRPRAGRDAVGALAAALAAEGASTPPAAVREVRLVLSRLGPGGAEHVPYARLPLGNRDAEEGSTDGEDRREGGVRGGDGAGADGGERGA